MDPQTQNTSLPRVQNVEKGVSDLELGEGVMEKLVSPSGEDMNSRAQLNVKDNRKNVTTGVTSFDSRITFYSVATLVVITILVGSIFVLWFDTRNIGTLHKLLYVFLSAATIPYIGLLFICLCNDVPVPSYRLGAEGRFGIYLATMVVIYCISYCIEDFDVRMEVSFLAIMSITGAVAIVQLHSPAEDLNSSRTTFILVLGTMSAILGCVAKDSWMSLSGSLCFFMVVMCLIKINCLAADHFEEQQRERRRRRHRHPDCSKDVGE
ncbi:unnamed protein product [Arabidopsis lyrata]|nr:unnamed protein product [Arabidopsis lyrata]